MALKINVDLIKNCVSFVMHVCNFVISVLEKVEVQNG